MRGLHQVVRLLQVPVPAPVALPHRGNQRTTPQEPVFDLLESLFQEEHSGESLGVETRQFFRAQRKKALVRHLRQRVCYQRQDEDTLQGAHGGETLYLSVLQ
jgi:hypothetical protein